MAKILSLALVAALAWAALAAQTKGPEIPPLPDKPNIGVAEDAWQALMEQRKTVAVATERGAKAAKATALADKAKDFYVAFPNNRSAYEARNVELLALIDAVESGDPGSKGRLNQAAADLRKNLDVPVGIRAKGVAAHAFWAAARNSKNQAEQRVAIEATARDVIKEFPSESPGYEALWALCLGSPNDASLALAKELAGSSAPEPIKSGAEGIVVRAAAIGKPLADIVPAAASVLAKLRAGEPCIVYSWSAEAPSSITVGQMIQARRFNAIGLSLDEAAAARETARKSGLGGEQIFDIKKSAVDWSNALKLTAPGIVIICDEKGIIRDVRGAEQLETKLATYGFKTPALIRP